MTCYPPNERIPICHNPFQRKSFTYPYRTFRQLQRLARVAAQIIERRYQPIHVIDRNQYPIVAMIYDLSGPARTIR